MEMHQVRYFLAICRTGNFTKAAEQCNVTQPALTRAIMKLEDELGGKLFHRDHKISRPSTLGQMMQPLLEQTYAAAEAARQKADQFRKSASGELSLGLAQTMSPELLMQPLAAINRKCDALHVSLQQQPPEQLLDALETGNLELAVLSAAVDLPDKLHSWPLFRESHRLALPAGHALAPSAVIPPASLTGLAWIDRPYCPVAQAFVARCREDGIDLDIRHRASSDEQVQHLVRAGLGVALLPEKCTPLSGVVFRAVEDFDVERTIVVVSRAGRPLGPASQALLRLARAAAWL